MASVQNIPINYLVTEPIEKTYSAYKWDQMKYGAYEKVSYVAFIALAATAAYFAAAVSIFGATVAIGGVMLAHQFVAKPYFFDYFFDKRKTAEFFKNMEFEILGAKQHLDSLSEEQFRLELTVAGVDPSEVRTAPNAEPVRNFAITREILTNLLAHYQVFSSSVHASERKVAEREAEIERLQETIRTDNNRDQEFFQRRQTAFARIADLRLQISHLLEDDDPTLGITSLYMGRLRLAYLRHLMQNPYDMRSPANMVQTTAMNYLERSASGDNQFAINYRNGRSLSCEWLRNAPIEEIRQELIGNV